MANVEEAYSKREHFLISNPNRLYDDHVNVQLHSQSKFTLNLNQRGGREEKQT